MGLIREAVCFLGDECDKCAAVRVAEITCCARRSAAGPRTTECLNYIGLAAECAANYCSCFLSVSCFQCIQSIPMFQFFCCFRIPLWEDHVLLGLHLMQANEEDPRSDGLPLTRFCSGTVL